MKDEIFGGKSGGSGESRTPVEDPDSLQSTAYARVLDLISEGPIVGLVDGQKSVYLNETPLVNADNSANFSGVTLDQRTGTQDQSHMPGFPSVESETAVGTDVQFGKPWSIGVNNLSLSAIRLRIGFPALFEQKDNGDTVGTSVSYQIQVSTDGGTFQTVFNETVTGKSTGGYERSRRVNLPKATTGWVVRFVRISPDSTSAKVANKTTVASYTEVIDAKFRYPNSAYIGVSVDASQFGANSIPTRAYHARGRIIRVPSNYDPVTRGYVGVWDGSFKAEYSNNPAWVFFDLCTHPRYGLGNLITAAQMDRYALYQIAQYCDELVPDGLGGTEPRFTCNAFFQTRVEAIKMLQDLASVFRGIAFWAGSSIIASADLPRDPVYLFNNGNVIAGKFTRGGSSKRSRASVALVSWNDPKDFYRSKVEYVEDGDTLRLFGYQPIEMGLIGCSSQGQAQRAGRWALLTNKLETGTIAFEVGLEGGGKYIQPGAVIKVADANFAGKRIGGRIRVATSDTITVDGSVALEVGDLITVALPTGLAEERTVSEALGQNRYRVSKAFTAVPVAEAPWAYETDRLVTELYRIVSISEREGDGELGYKINAVTYAPGKHAAVDSGTRIDLRPVTIIPPSAQKAPTNVRISESHVVEQTIAVNSMDIMWDQTDNAVYYEVQWRRDSLQWVSAGQTSQLQVTVQGIYTGVYEARVRAYNALGVSSVWSTTKTATIRGKTGAPPALASLVASTDKVFSVELKWSFPDGAADTEFTEIVTSKTARFEEATPLGKQSYPTTSLTINGAAAGANIFFWGRLVDKSGNVGPWTGPALGRATTDPVAVNEVMNQEFLDSAFGKEFFSDVALITADASVPGSVNSRLKTVQDAATAQITQVQQGLSDTNLAVQDIQQDLANIGDLADAQEYKSDKAYTAGNIVTRSNVFYQAKVDVPAGKTPPDTAYWRNAGDIIKEGDGLAARVTSQGQTITQQGTTITANSNDITQLKTSVAGKADSSALNSLTSRVSTAEGKIDSQGQAITSLQSSVANKADASALNSLTSRVASAEGKIDSQANSITNLQTGLKTNTDGLAATNQTVSNLSSTVSQQGSAITSQGQSITSINSALTDVGGENLLFNPSFDVWASDTQLLADGWEGGSDGAVVWSKQPSTLEPSGFMQRATLTGLSDVKGAYTTNQFSVNKTVGGNQQVALSVYMKATAGAQLYIAMRNLDASQNSLNYVESTRVTATGDWQRISFVATTVAGTVFTRFVPRVMGTASLTSVVWDIDRAQMELGGRVTGWRDSGRANLAAINAQATATNQLASRVSSVEGTVTSQASSITNLRSDLTALDGRQSSTASALSSLTTTVTQQGGNITNQAGQITNLQTSVKGAVQQSFNMVPNPTFDPAFNTMGFYIVKTTDAGVPANCPFPYAARITNRDNFPDINSLPNFPVKAGDVYRFSALVAAGAGTGTRPFQHYATRATSPFGGRTAYQASQMTSVTQTWTRVNWDHTIPAGQTFLNPMLQIETLNAETATWYVTDWHCENITAAKQAQATADAAATATSNLSTRVTTAESSITAQAGQITSLQASIAGAGAFVAGLNFEFLNSTRGFYLEQAATGATLTAYQQNATITGYANLRTPAFAAINGVQNTIIRMRIRRKSTTRNPGRIYWANEDGGLDGNSGRTATFNIDLNNPGFQDIEIDLGGNTAWSTKTAISSIRFDFLNTQDTSAVVDIAYIAIGRKAASASATALSDVQATVTQQGSNISTLVSKTDTLQSTINGQTSSLQQISQIQTDTSNRLNASWQLKFATTGNNIRYVSGIGFSVDGGNDGNGQPNIQTTLAIAADRFLLMGPGIDGYGRTVFSVINGQTFINEAFIDKASINRALIGQTIASQRLTAYNQSIMTTDYYNGNVIVRDLATNGAYVQMYEEGFRMVANNIELVKIGRIG
ncbi:MAG: tail component protein [Caudoviricetes sp.]|nr:MAG: tail component protein [Caudoviricetes sp.]